MPGIPENKMKEEVYSQLGGINSKAGLYSNGPMEFQVIANLDFQQPGALTQRWGSTLYQTQNFSGPISALYEFIKLDGSSYMIVGTSGALWSGATTGQAQGLSLTSQGVTVAIEASFSKAGLDSGKITINPLAFILYQGLQNQILGGDINAGVTIYGTSLFVNPQVMRSNQMDFVTYQNYMFMGDGNCFLKFDGATTSLVGLPPATARGVNSFTYGGSMIDVTYTSVTTALGFAIAPTLVFGIYASYVNSRNFEGPIWPIGIVSTAGMSMTTAATLGGTFVQIAYHINTPLAYDISSINLYCYAYVSAQLNDLQGSSFWNYSYKLISNTLASGSTTTTVQAGINAIGQSVMAGNGGQPPPLVTYLPLGFTIQSSLNSKFISEVDIVNFAPRFLELHQNRLFLAGFSLNPSLVWFSDVAEPEGYDPSFNFEVRTNDGDRITALKDYNSRLYIFKQFSFSELSGDNPDNFFEREVSNQYGCLSNRAVAVYNDIMLFLDSKGVMQFNGAGLQCISTKVQPTFDSMNVTAALDQATMVHDKTRNQILIGIPVNGSTTNNLTVVYDYLSDCWTKYDGYSPALYAVAKGRFTNKTAMFGGYSGQVMNFGQSLASDNGTGFTTYFKTGFHSDEGYTNTKLWRRLWTNVDEVTGVTVPCNINFFQDYGTSIVLNRTSYLSPFQTRLDFGIAAKAIAFEFSKLSATTMIRYYGHGLAYRSQRNV